MGDVVKRYADEVADRARDGVAAVTDIIGHYLRAVDGFNEVAAFNGNLQATLEQTRADLADTHAMITRLQDVILYLAENVELDARGRDEADRVRRERLAAETVQLRATQPAVRPQVKGFTSVPPSEASVPLGVCPRCDQTVYSGQSFDMARKWWGADFPGDKPGVMLVFTHREHGDGDHSKDGV